MPATKAKVVVADEVKRVVVVDDQEDSVRGLSINASSSDNIVSALECVISNGSGGELTWASADGKPHSIISGDTKIVMQSGTKATFEFSDECGTFKFLSPRPVVSSKVGPIRINSPVLDIKLKSDNSGVARVELAPGITKSAAFKIEWSTVADEQAGQRPSAAIEERSRPLVWCYTTPGCGPCIQAKRELSSAKLPFDVRFTEDCPAWVYSQPGGARFPLFHFNDSKGVGHKVVGWVGVQELTRLVMERQQAAVSSGPRWTYAGGDTKPALIEHLLRDGIHKGKFSKDYLERLSRDALVQLHSDDHNGIYRN